MCGTIYEIVNVVVKAA